jgi:hypothetical protein
MNAAGTRLALPPAESVETKITTTLEMEKHLDGLKLEINALLFKWLPDSATIKDVERLSCAIYFELHDRWEKHLIDTF